MIISMIHIPVGIFIVSELIGSRSHQYLDSEIYHN